MLRCFWRSRIKRERDCKQERARTGKRRQRAGLPERSTLDGRGRRFRRQKRVDLQPRESDTPLRGIFKHNR